MVEVVVTAVVSGAEQLAPSSMVVKVTNDDGTSAETVSLGVDGLVVSVRADQ